MSQTFPTVYLARHGETAWSITGQHTGRTDLPLTARGEDMARLLGGRLKGMTVAHVFTSPSRRAVRTCELAGFGDRAENDADLLEWDYGKYEGRLTADILIERPGWDLFRDGCPGGESPANVAARADRVGARVRQVHGNVLIFSSGHLLRMLAARWIGADPTVAQGLMLHTASLSSLSHEHADSPAISLWNDTAHVATLREPEHPVDLLTVRRNPRSNASLFEERTLQHEER
jgi:probable phosphoglycerate mutase